MHSQEPGPRCLSSHHRNDARGCLALDRHGRYVVIELKVSRGYDRVVGQLLRYMGWVEQNMETSQPARGIIVANEITADLKLAFPVSPTSGSSNTKFHLS